ncbi:hypothetical protein GCM10027586_10610 [Kineococcus gypseus]
MEELRALAVAARRLGAYEDALEAELELVTDVLVQRYRELVGPPAPAAPGARGVVAAQ